MTDDTTHDSIRVHARLPADLVEALDRYARRVGISRSAALVVLLRQLQADGGM